MLCKIVLLAVLFPVRAKKKKPRWRGLPFLYVPFGGLPKPISL